LLSHGYSSWLDQNEQRQDSASRFNIRAAFMPLPATGSNDIDIQDEATTTPFKRINYMVQVKFSQQDAA
jgi:hypothetical protein